MLLLSFIVANAFGREYAEGTAKNLLALPVGRHWIVLAKFAVAATWWLVLVVAVLAEAFVVGLALGLPGFSARPAASYAVLAFTFVAGVGATIAQVRYADNVQ
jgi:ABC-2 type transport system permease protein